MIVKRDLMCLFGQTAATPASVDPTRASPVTARPVSASSPMGGFSNSTYSTFKSSAFSSRHNSIATASPFTASARGYTPSEKSVKEEEEEEEAILETQAQIDPDWVKRKAEKEAFGRTFGSAIKETSGDDVEYLHTTRPN
jgi:hypothetical protein